MPKVLNPHELPACMIGPSEPCDAFTILQEKLSKAEHERNDAQRASKLWEARTHNTEAALAKVSSGNALMEEILKLRIDLAKAEQEREEARKDAAFQCLRAADKDCELGAARNLIESIYPEMKREHDIGDGHFSTTEVEAARTFLERTSYLVSK